MKTIRIPRVYRYLDKKYVRDFFEDGSLRLSSFASFAKYADEQRLDPEEGKAALFHRTAENGGQTLYVKFEFDDGAYVLCGSSLPSLQLMKDFKTDSAIIIRDAEGFAQAVAKVVPNCTGYVHGVCSYQALRAIERDLGWIDIADKSTNDPAEMNEGGIRAALSQLVTDDILFLKHASFSHQVEYRFLWFAEQLKDHLEIQVPDAAQFCERWEDQGQWIAVKENSN